jgi:BirA family biotin operon repressor/biotin-[acetyl-CoA-carboxylase] ligase
MHKILANTIFLGKDIIGLSKCHSTNEVAFRKFKANEVKEGSIIITEKQTKGRGQRGNSWISEPGMNLTFSLILTPSFLDPSEQFGLNMTISLGIREALSEYVTGIKVKWPNDIVHEENGKLGGILIENSLSNKGIELSVVGVGINVNQIHFTFPNTASVSQLAGSPMDKEELFRRIITGIEKYYLLLKKGHDKNIKEMYQSHLYRYGELSNYNDGKDFLGEIVGISDQGKLIIKKENKSLHQYAFKEVKFV